MQFGYSDLGHLHGGEMVEVTLNSQANVLLLDSSNFNSFKNGRQHRYYGGLATRSPVTIPVPHSGRWNVVVHLGGHRGSVRWNARVLPGRLRPIQERPLSSVPSLVREPDPVPANDDTNVEIRDVFISHASEDKDEIARPLADALRAEGLTVWYDDYVLKIGDSLRRKIDSGIAHSRFGIVILSQSFFDKGWTNYELDGLVSRSVDNEQVLLPIWHKVSKAEVKRYSASLVDKVARSTTQFTPDEIAREISNMIRGIDDEDDWDE